MERLPRLSRVPVIFLSAYGWDQIIAQALEAGADDYIVKPFSPTELVARIQTVLRRRAVPATAEPAEPFVSGELTIDYGERRVSLSGRSIPLTHKEYRLLYELSVNAGRVVPHDHLLQALWGPRTPRASGAGADRGEEPPPQAWRRRAQPHPHPQRAPHRLPHAEG